MKISKEIEVARGHGDTAEEGPGPHAAKEKQSHIEGRILNLNDWIARAEVIDVSKLSGDKVVFGATVKLLDVETDKEVTYRLVGELEADIKRRLISVTSPLARGLIGEGGRRPGDRAEPGRGPGVRGGRGPLRGTRPGVADPGSRLSPPFAGDALRVLSPAAGRSVRFLAQRDFARLPTVKGLEGLVRKALEGARAARSGADVQLLERVARALERGGPESPQEAFRALAARVREAAPRPGAPRGSQAQAAAGRGRVRAGSTGDARTSRRRRELRGAAPDDAGTSAGADDPASGVGRHGTAPARTTQPPASERTTQAPTPARTTQPPASAATRPAQVFEASGGTGRIGTPAVAGHVAPGQRPRNTAATPASTASGRVPGVDRPAGAPARRRKGRAQGTLLEQPGKTGRKARRSTRAAPEKPEEEVARPISAAPRRGRWPSPSGAAASACRRGWWRR